MAKPRRPTTDWLVYVAVRVIAMIFHMFPIDLNLKTARVMGWVWYRVMRRHRERAREHLRAAFGPQFSEKQIDRIALMSMQQMTMMAIETLFTPRLINEWTWPRYIQLKGIDQALAHLLDHKGAILLTAHYGNWELLGYALATIGFPLTAVMRPLDNPYLNQWLMDVRAKRGLQLLYKKGAAKSAHDILIAGDILAFIADQNAGRKGLFVDFFGRKASTYKSIGLLAIEHRVPIVIGYARRCSGRFEYEVGVTRIIRTEEWAGQPDELKWITQEYTTAIEKFVRQEPEQYLWMHRRWKSRPKEELENNAADTHESADEEVDGIAVQPGPLSG